MKAKAKKARKAGTSKASASQRVKQFVEAYLSNGENATQAAISAGYSKKTARQQGSRLLTDVAVSKAISARREQRNERAEEITDIKAADLLKSADRAVKFNLKKLYPNLDDDAGLALELSGGKLKLDRAGARDQLMKHFGLYKRDNEQKPVIPVPEGVAVGRLTVSMDFKKVKAGARAAARRA